MSVHQVELGEDEDSFIQAQISQGRYASAADVLKAGLASLEHSADADSEWRAWLCAEAKIGFDQLDAGQRITLRNESEIHEFMDAMLERVRSKRAVRDIGR